MSREVRILRLAAFVLVVLAIGPGVGFAQTTADGTVRGTVTDTQGAVMPGVAVSATSPRVAGSHTTVTDGSGVYRLTLPPGEYVIMAEIMGFSKWEQKGILVRSGMTIAVNVALQVGNMSETIEVKSEVPLLDAASPTQATNITGELQRELPTSPRRDYTDFLEMTPGMNSYVSPSRGAGLYHMRGSRIESHVVQIDGADMNSLRQARPDYIGLSTDTLEDVQVKSSVSDATAPLGNGAVMNIATPSGTNSFKGAVAYNYANRDWHSNNNPNGQTNSSSLSLLDASGGGPLKPNASWMFGTFRKIDRQIGMGGRTNEIMSLAKAVWGQDWQPFDNAFTGAFFFIKNTTQIGQHRIEAFYESDRSPTEGNYFYETLNSSVSVFGGKGAAARISSVWGNAAATRFSVSWNNKTINPQQSDFADYIRLDQQLPYRPLAKATLISSGHPSGSRFVNIGVQETYAWTPTKKITIAGDLSLYKSGFGGSHELQIGFYLQPVLWGKSTTFYANNGNPSREDVVLIDPNDFSKGYRPYHRVFPDVPSYTSRQVAASDNAVYFQDAWRPSSRLTVTAGLRVDMVRATDELVNVRTQNSVEVGPRTGATYSLTKDNHNIIYGTWGRVGDLVLLDDVPTLGSVKVGYWEYWDDKGDGSFTGKRYTPGASGTSTSNRVDPNRRQPWFQEWTAGYRRQFKGQMTLSVGFAQRNYLDRPANVESNGVYDGVRFVGWGAWDPAQNTMYLITNDSWNQQEYDAIETSFSKKTDKLQIISSYVRQWRHLNGTWQPNDNASYLQPSAFPNDKAIGTPRVAPSNSIVPGGADVFGNTAWQDHTFRISAVYELPKGFQAAAHYVFQSGPWTGAIVNAPGVDPRFGPTADFTNPFGTGRKVPNPLAIPQRFEYATRSDGQVKAPNRQEINLKFARKMRFGRRAVELGLDVFNLMNRGALERWDSGAGQDYKGGGWLAYESVQPPRSIDLIAKFTF